MTRKSRLAFALSLAAAVAGTPGSALAQQGDPVYDYYYYSEPGGYVVGIHHGDCIYSGPRTHVWLEGDTSPYSQQVLVAYCYQGILQPL